MISSIRKSRLATLILIILGCVLVFMVQWNASELLAPLHLQSKSLVRYILKCLLSLIPVTIIMFILHKPSAIMESLGFKGSILRGLLFGFLFTTPLYIGFAIIGHFNAGRNIVQGLYIRPVVQGRKIRILLGRLAARCPVRPVSHLSRARPHVLIGGFWCDNVRLILF